MENIGNFTVAKRWGSFLLLYLGYMVLFADRTVMNITSVKTFMLGQQH